MTRFRLQSSVNRYAEATIDLAIPKRIEDSAGLGSQTNGSGDDPKSHIDESIEDYLQMASRMLYDMIREWRECRSNKEPITQPIKSEPKCGRQL